MADHNQRPPVVDDKQQPIPHVKSNWGNTLLVSGMVVVLVIVFLYLSRGRWYPGWTNFLNKIFKTRQYSFLEDREAGMSSESFNLSENISSGDSRQGLDSNAKNEIKRIMKRRGVTFDEARAIYTNNRMQKHNINPDGRPNDPKAIFFS